MSYTREYNMNGFDIEFTDWGILLDPKTARLDDPEYIEALKKSQRLYDTVNNLGEIAEYKWSLHRTSDEDLAKLAIRCDWAEQQTEIPLSDFDRQCIREVREEISARKNPRPEPDPIPLKSEKPGYIYLLKSDRGYYKIGRTKDPQNRLKIFTVRLPFEVELEHLVRVKNMRAAETLLHQMFDAKRADGEWFVLDEDDVAYIKSLDGDV